MRQHLRLGSIEDVREALQEAMLRICARHLDGEPDPDNLAAFVNVTVRNILIDKLRRVIPLSLSEGDVDEAAEGTAPQLPDLSFASPDDALAWKQLLHIVLDRLPAKWMGIAAKVMSGATPEELAEAYGQNGYVLRRYTRELICRILTGLAQTGEPLARSFGRDFCGWSRGSTAGSRAQTARAGVLPQD